jgi:hypothetical protein
MKDGKGGLKQTNAKVEVVNLSGIDSSIDGESFEDGVATSQSDELGKLLHDLHVQLMSYMPEVTRHAGKKTSVSFFMRNYRTGSRNPRLYIDTEKFVSNTSSRNTGFD